MLIGFFGIKGIVHFELVPQSQTVIQQFYLETLKRLRDVVRRNRPELWRSGEWLLHYDYAHAHTALSVRQILTKWPRNPLLTRTWHAAFFPFPRMKRELKGKRFQNVDEVKNDTGTEGYHFARIPELF